MSRGDEEKDLNENNSKLLSVPKLSYGVTTTTTGSGTTVDSEYDDLPLSNCGGKVGDEGTKERIANIKNFGEFTPIPFNSSIRKGFIGGLKTDVQITKVERSLSHILNPYLYTIEIQHGHYHWTICRRCHHFWNLHRALIFHKTSRQINKTLRRGTTLITSSSSQEDNIDDEESINKNSREMNLPRFPKRPDSMVSQDADDMERRRKLLQNYLQSVLQCAAYRNHPETLMFFEVSEFSFVNGMLKGKEGILKKRTGDDFILGSGGILSLCFQCSSKFRINKWIKIWLIVQESYLLGIKPKSGEIRLVLLFDKDFKLSSGFKQTGTRHGLRISNLTRSLNLKTWTNRKNDEWTQAIESAMRSENGKSFIQGNRYKSFAPVRANQEAIWFVDGEGYMSAVATAIQNAKEQIFISDWWLSPEIFLKRGLEFSEEYRLDHLLKKKADQGVRIFILLYKELSLALGLNSLYTKQTLSGKNIKVLRHPDHSSADLYDHLWAHHEKLVIVDQSYAFVGGIDLCYGRWDTQKHPLTDIDATDSTCQSLTHLPSVVRKPNTSSRMNQKPIGHEHIAFVLRSAHEVTVTPIRAFTDADGATITKKKEAKTPGSSSSSDNDDEEDSDNEDEDFGDDDEEEAAEGGGDRRRRRRRRRRHRKKSSAVKIRKRLRDAVSNAKNKARNKLRKQRSDSDSDDSMPDANEKRGLENVISLSDEDLSGAKGEGGGGEGASGGDHRKRKISMIIPHGGLGIDEGDENSNGASVLWKGKDYVNFIVKDIARPEQFDQDNVDRRSTPRMPWHDIALMVRGASARDAARHFIQRWNAIKTEKSKFNPNYPFLLPKSYEDLPNLSPIEFPGLKSSNVSCQVLRSSSSWSAGIDEVESSIHEAIVEAITEAEHYIYIENQFFITTVNTSPAAEVKNGIGAAIYERILKAHKEKKVFRVYVLLPLLPAFEGQIGSSATGQALRVILHYNYAAICRGEHSLWKRLEKVGITPINYLSFCSLRTTGELLGSPVTELVYIHAKLLIVDDRLVICGSANINDRSLLGNRDSEVCLVIEDTEFDEEGTEMNGVKYPSGKFAGSLRRALMKEHLGIEKGSCDEASVTLLRDPICDYFYKDIWLKTASKNTKIFDDVFLVIPNDEVQTMAECRTYEEKVPLADIDRFAANKAMKNIKGNLVLLPLQFLRKEVLTPSYLAKEGMVPSVTWT